MNKRRVILFCLLGLILSTAAHAKIVFSSTRDGVKGVYVMDDDGSNQALLIEADRVRFPYSWSPDGKYILLQSFGLSLMNSDGTNIRELIDDDGGSIGRGSFSPDSKSIVFNWSFEKNGKLKYGVYVLNIKTLKVKEIARQVMASNCDWSPDGNHIVFSEWITTGVHSTIWIMDADGHNRRTLIPKPPVGAEFTINRSRPRWSPDGKQIVFTEREYKTVRVPNVGESPFFKAFRYIICDRNGENIRQLRIPKDQEALGVDWMDDGKSIVFSARAAIPLNKVLPRDFDFPPANIYKYHIRTREITRLTNHPGMDVALDWISDDVLSVTPHGKKKVTWGTIKE